MWQLISCHSFFLLSFLFSFYDLHESSSRRGKELAALRTVVFETGRANKQRRQQNNTSPHTHTNRKRNEGKKSPADPVAVRFATISTKWVPRHFRPPLSLYPRLPSSLPLPPSSSSTAICRQKAERRQRVHPSVTSGPRVAMETMSDFSV